MLVQNFFSHSDLLEKGLSDWSANIGAVRNNLGTENANYGRRFGSGLVRYGLTQTSRWKAAPKRLAVPMVADSV